ncbi:MAG TPA: DUF1080 domain-containing protein [Cytophagales bacterium]|jgi:hypothetical protein|nr:DUF1080 domain-containing protein [Cytophagales bacterium]
MTAYFTIIFALSVLTACQQQKQEKKWTPIFNGENLDNWTIKISGSELHENFGNTFRVEDNMMKVRYDQYEQFGNRFGHIFYNTPQSNYRLRLKYRFMGEKMEDSPAWTLMNNGVMIHAQDPATMALVPDPLDTAMNFMDHFPVSVECQLLGQPEDKVEMVTTANICKVGSSFQVQGEVPEKNIFPSTIGRFPSGQWVNLELIVYSDSLVHHVVNRDTVATYTNLQLADGTPLTNGYIAFQSEAHPIDFKDVELMELK